MKSLYGIGTDMERVFKDVQIEVFIDSILNQSVLAVEDPADTVRVKMGNKRIVVIEKDKKGDKSQRKIIIDEDVSERNDQIHQEEDKDYGLKDDKDEGFFKNQHASWAGFGIGLNGFMNSNDRFFSESDAPFLMLDYAKSVNVQFNVWDKRFPIYQEFIGVTTGLGFQWNRYGLEKNVDISANADSIYAINNLAVNYTKNVLCPSSSLYFSSVFGLIYIFLDFGFVCYL